MKEMLTIRTKDLKRLHAAVDPAHLGTPGDGIPTSILEAIFELVRCDDVSYNEIDPVNRRMGLDRDLIYVPDSDTPGEPDPDFDDYLWRLNDTELACSYHYRTGDRTTVRRATDFYPSHREFLASEIAEFHRLLDARYSTLIPLPPMGSIQPRLILWRQRGNFTDRDQLLLNLLRPHLAELHVKSRIRDRSNELTNRQLQVLAHVAEGLTNRQISGRLQISEGTVRTHIENIFERLSVTSRAAAVSHATSNPNFWRSGIGSGT